MTDPSEKATEEELAAKACADAAMERIQGWTGAQIAVAAFGQAQQSQAALIGIIELLLHQGKYSQADLGDAMAWSYRKRAHELLAQAKKQMRGEGSEILLPAAPAARHRQ